MNGSQKRRLDAGIIFAIGLVVLGSLLVIKQVYPTWRFQPWNFWPLLLVAIGIVQIMQPRETRHWLLGLYLIIVGFVFLGSKLGWTGFTGLKLEMENLWPFFLVLVGIMLLERHLRIPQDTAGDSDYIRISAILGGGNYSYTSKTLKGATITAIMGGCSLDLRGADMEGDTMVIDTFAVWGGIEIKPPPHWVVNVQGTPILGAMENKAARSPNGAAGQAGKVKRLIIKGAAIMGGVEVKG